MYTLHKVCRLYFIYVVLIYIIVYIDLRLQSSIN